MKDRNPNALRNTSMFMVKAGSETMNICHTNMMALMVKNTIYP